MSFYLWCLGSGSIGLILGGIGVWAVLTHRISTLTARLEAQQTFQTQHTDLKTVFQATASDVMEKNQKQFLDLAQQMFQAERQAQTQELEKARQATENHLKPVQDTLHQYQKHLRDFEEKSYQSLGAVGAQLTKTAEMHDRLMQETTGLSNALRSNTTATGKWGEYQLRNILELAEMTEHTDYSCQVSMETDTDQRIRPDAIIHMPGGMKLVVDAKTSLSAYLDAMQAETAEDRTRLLTTHANTIARHAKDLGKKDYWRTLRDIGMKSTDMVAMFIPGENFYAAAIQHKPDLFQTALESRVLIVSPTTLLAVARSIAFGWQQVTISEDAARIAEAGDKLYDRLCKTLDHVAKTGKNLDSAVKSYNDFIGSLDAKTLPAAREIRRLRGKQDLPVLEPIESTSRLSSSPERKNLLSYANSDT